MAAFAQHLAQNFDLTNGFNILRIICGLFLVPHMVTKASNLPFTYEIYRQWRLYPPKAWVLSCIAVEIVGSIGLVFAIYTRYVAALVAELNRFGEDRDFALVASMYRHLSPWPAYLLLLRARLAPLWRLRRRCAIARLPNNWLHCT